MSASIIIQHDPEGINKRDVHPVSAGTCLCDWLIGEYGSDGFQVPTIIMIGDVTIDQDDFNSMNRLLKDGDIVSIIHQPLGTELLVALIIAVVAIVLIPDISPPPRVENPNFPKTNESPNNRLSGQTNIARPLARIPDIYGRSRVYPDLGAKTATEFISHVKFVTEYLIIGRGEYDLDELKSGETLIGNLDGTSTEIYNPGDLIPSLLDVTDSNEVNGQEVKAPNDTGEFSTSATNVTFTASTKIFGTAAGNPLNIGMTDFFALTAGDQFDVSGTGSNDGTYTFVAFTYGVTLDVEVEETLVDEFVATSVDFDETAGTDPSTQGPFIVPTNTEEVWVDLQCPRGLADRRSGTSVTITVLFDVILEELDEFGAVIGTETFPISIADDTLDARFYTFKITPGNPGNDYQCTVQRLTDTENDASYYDTTKWTRLGGVAELTNFDQGNITSIVLTSQATDQATKAQQRKFNTIATRKLRSYDTGTSSITPTLTASLKMADALFEHLTNEFIGNKADSDIDLEGLYAIQDALDTDAIYGDTLGRFCYSFSDERAGVRDELLVIANSCRVVIKKIGDSIEFTRDEIRDVRTTLFNSRNKKPRSENKSRHLHKPSDQDGIEIQWRYEDTGETFTETFEPAGGALNPKKIDAAGIRNFNQAWNRGKIEFLKLKLQRESVKFDSTKEGLFVEVGDRVANADGTDVTAQNGEVKNVDGLNIETYTPIDFQGNLNATVIMRDESGNVSDEINVTPRGDSLNGFTLDNSPGFTLYVRGNLGYQVGTLYTFALTGEERIRDYILQKRSPKSDNYVTLELLNYDPAVYGPDTEVPPAHETTT